MKILAIDSSGMPASVAVCEDGTLERVRDGKVWGYMLKEGQGTE